MSLLSQNQLLTFAFAFQLIAYFSSFKHSMISILLATISLFSTNLQLFLFFG